MSWYGCRNFQDSPYHWQTEDPTDSRKPRLIGTEAGSFLGFQCSEEKAWPIATYLFYSVYILLTSWVIMSLFIGVISSGMFEAFLRVKLDSNKEKYMRSLEVNTSLDDEDARKKLKQNRRTSVAAPRRHTMSTPFVELLQGALRPHPSLQELIDTAMSDEVLDGKRGHHSTMEEAAEHLIEQAAALCRKVRDATWFTVLVTLSILVVGVMVGWDTDAMLRCDRLDRRVDAFWLNATDEYVGDPDSSASGGGGGGDGFNGQGSAAVAAKFNTLSERSAECESRSEASIAVDIAALVIFTVEALVKILAEGMQPLRYFQDPWNVLDFFVVLVGYIELSPIFFIFEAFPVVILRLLRLLRVFRLAKVRYW